jgi:hypothetical protein
MAAEIVPLSCEHVTKKLSGERNRWGLKNFIKSAGEPYFCATFRAACLAFFTVLAPSASETPPTEYLS